MLPRKRKKKHPPTIRGYTSLRFKHNISARCSFDIFISTGDPLRIERATCRSSSQDVHKWWQVCVRGRLQMTHLSFYFKASFGHHPSMRDRATLTGLQSCLCASLYRQVVLSSVCLFNHLQYAVIYKELVPLRPSSPIFSLRLPHTHKHPFSLKHKVIHFLSFVANGML